VASPGSKRGRGFIGSSDLNGYQPVFPGNTADICPNTFLNGGCYPIVPTFRAEDDVIEQI